MVFFKDMELSEPTKRGLKEGGYSEATEIQEQTIGKALQGSDILGAAKTGSGKTLAFVIPLLERLFAENWTSLDGIGALVITPTRELAYQIFEVLRKVGAHHDFSAGLVIGGKDKQFEKTRMSCCNIVICTPGRILDHMDHNPEFTADNLKIFILDEADRIMDGTFASQMNAIIDFLPKDRQTLLFSATQTKSVKDLARLSLKDATYVSVHEHSKTTTPDKLVQSYLVCELHDKLNLLWSFIKNHSKTKVLVFMSTCKQVKYTYELFCRLRPGATILALYGSLHQLKRMAVYDEFCRKQNAVLIATDIASRGLDFPAVNWVVQMDCPEDVNTYIHRSGRTARFTRDGEALLVLLPSEEESMVNQLSARKIPINSIRANPRKFVSIQRKTEAYCAGHVGLKESAQRAFKAYLKNVFYMKDKSVFNLDKLNVNLFSRSLGLIVTPRVRFLEKGKGNKKDPEKEKKGKEKVIGKERKQSSSLFKANDSSSENEEELFTVKSVWRPDEDNKEEDDLQEKLRLEKSRSKEKHITKAAMAKKMLKKKIKPNTKVVFDEEGAPAEEFPTKQTSEKLKELELKLKKRKVGGIDIELAKEIMRDEDKIDKKLERKLKRERKLALKLKFKEKKKKDNDTTVAVLENESDEDNETLDRYIDELPDPDKIYKKRSSDDDYEDEDEESSDEDEDETRFAKRRKLVAESDSEDVDDEDDEDDEDEQELQDSEALALHLLRNT